MLGRRQKDGLSMGIESPVPFLNMKLDREEWDGDFDTRTLIEISEI